MGDPGALNRRPLAKTAAPGHTGSMHDRLATLSLPPALVRLLAAGVVVLLSGCATTVPEPIRTDPADPPDLAEAQSAPEEHQDAPVRWGGVVLRLDNLADGTQVEILARPLDGAARPRDGDRSAGRFIARFPDFIDPAVVTAGREITVVGTLDGTLSRTIDDFAYTYPVVAVTGHHL